MNADLQRTVLGLPAQERQELVEILWQSLETEPVTLPLWQRQLIDQRLADLEANPERGSSWEEVEKRLWPEA